MLATVLDGMADLQATMDAHPRLPVAELAEDVSAIMADTWRCTATVVEFVAGGVVRSE